MLSTKLTAHSWSTFIAAIRGAVSLMLQNAPPALALPPGGRSLYVAHDAEDQAPQGEGSTLARFTFDATGLLTPAETLPGWPRQAIGAASYGKISKVVEARPGSERLKFLFAFGTSLG